MKHRGDTVSAFLAAARKFASLSPAEVKVLKPIVVEVVAGRLDKKALIEMSREGKLDPRFNESRPGETSADRLSPLGLALAFLLNNFRLLT